jgi:hypothetical protein
MGQISEYSQKNKPKDELVRILWDISDIMLTQGSIKYMEARNWYKDDLSTDLQRAQCR